MNTPYSAPLGAVASTLRLPALTLPLLAAAVLLASCASSPSSASSSAQPLGKIVFYDDFSGPELDRTKWTVRKNARPPNNELEDYVDSPETLYIGHGDEVAGAENGRALVLKAIYQPAVVPGKDFISARLDTNGQFLSDYGTWAARIKLTSGAGLWPAFWALGTGRWPDTGEIDIMENVGDPTWTNVALHGPGYSGNTPLVKRSNGLMPPNYSITDWHVYSLDWTPQIMLFKVDGKTFYTVTRAMIEHYGRYAYDNPKYIILNLALGGSYPAGVNKARTPYAGLPDASVQIIKDGNAKMLVNWVRVSDLTPEEITAADAQAPAADAAATAPASPSAPVYMPGAQPPRPATPPPQ